MHKVTLAKLWPNLFPFCARSRLETAFSFWHFNSMNVAIPAEGPVTASFAAKAARQTLELWVTFCNEFRRRERQEIIEQKPSPKRLAEHEKDLKLMIRSAQTLLSLVSDPDFPERQFIPEISGKLLQLRSSLEMLQNPMTEVEADALIQKFFPNESRPRGAA